MSGLGERREYGQYARTLGSAVHYDAHVLMLYAADTSFRFDGLGSSWLVQLGRLSERSQLYPGRAFIDELEARGERARDLEALEKALEMLREYDPVLHHVAFTVCMAGGAHLTPGRGTRHGGAIWNRVVKDVYGGNDTLLWRHLQVAWSLVAVLVVTPEVLAAAEAAGAVDAKALSWARGRGLVTA